MINESYIFSKDDLYINFDKFESGESNICLITGLSGSGKSTLGRELCKKYKAEYVELDKFYLLGSGLKGISKTFDPFFKKYRKLYKELESETDNEESPYILMDSILNYCKSLKNTKFIIEGVQLFSYPSQSLKRYPMIFKNTSALKSMKRMMMRDRKDITDPDENGKNQYMNYIKYIPKFLRYYIEDEKEFRKFKQAMLSERSDYMFEGLETINESLSGYTRINMTDNNIKKYKSKSKGLSHIRTGKDYTGIIYIDNQDNVVGFYNLRISDNYIQAIEVDKSYQSKGIGKQLLQECIKHGATRLSVNKKNEIAINMYKKNNFKIIKEDKNMYYMELNKPSKTITECNTLSQLNRQWFEYMMQPFDEQQYADKLCIETYNMTNRERYIKLYEDLSTRINIDNINESVSTEFEPDFVNTTHNTSFISRLNDLPYFTPIDMSELGVFSKASSNYYGEPSDYEDNYDWYKAYDTLQYGVVPENFKDLNKKRVKRLIELSKDFDTNKQKVLDLGWNPEVPFNTENRIKATENTKAKLLQCNNQFYDATSMTEGVSVEKNIYVDFDKFVSGDNNVCLITGLSGSGKTTLANQLASKYGATVVSIDRFGLLSKKGKELEKIDPVLYSYLSKREKLWDNLISNKLKGNDMTHEIEKYLDYCISYCNKDKNNKYIIEGVQIFWLMNGGNLKGCSLVCVDTSAIRSALRRVKRANKLNKEAGTSLQGKLYDALDSIKMDKDATRGYNAFKKEVKDGIYEASFEKDKNPVYIIMVYTGSAFGKLIKRYTHGVYTHAAIAIDGTLDKLYSFNLANNYSKLGGFSIESLDGYIRDNKDGIMCVYTVFITDEQKRKLKKQLDYFTYNVDKTKYSIFNVFTMIANKPVELANDMICSQFVDRMLKMIDMDITGKASALVTPNDLYKSTSNKVFKVFEGRLDEYDKRKSDRTVKKLSKSAITERHSPVEFDKEGNLLILKDIKDIETEYNKSHKLLMSYDKTGNYDAMKPELCKLWYMNNKLEYIIFKTKKRNKKYEDMRARVLNDFNKYLKIVNTNDPSYVFSNDYDNSRYGDSSFKISKHTLKYGIDYGKRLLRP